MKKVLVILTMVFAAKIADAQKVDSIFFNLYTDSLKKGFYNYINIDGKLSDGTWQPLDSTQVFLISDAGFFRGNDLFVDSSIKEPFIKIRAVLKSNPRIRQHAVVYIRKRGFDEPLKTDEEILNNMGSNTKKKSRN